MHSAVMSVAVEQEHPTTQRASAAKIRCSSAGTPSPGQWWPVGAARLRCFRVAKWCVGGDDRRGRMGGSPSAGACAWMDTAGSPVASAAETWPRAAPSAC